MTKEDANKINALSEAGIRDALKLIDANYDNCNSDFILELRRELEETLKKFVIILYPNQNSQQATTATRASKTHNLKLAD